MHTAQLGVGGVGLAGFLRHGQGVEVGAHQHRRPLPVAHDRYDATPAFLRLQAHAHQLFGDAGAGLHLLHGQLRVLVEPDVQFLAGFAGGS